MSKVNVYLSDDLRNKVGELGIPVSKVCQRALWEEVMRVDGNRRCRQKGCKRDAEYVIQADGFDPEFVCSDHVPDFLVSNGEATVRGLAFERAAVAS
jgi:hypothetical protein